MRKLNMWQRLGVVVSLLWIVGAGTWQRNSDQQLANVLSFTTYDDCKNKPLPQPTSGVESVIDQCATDVQEAHDYVMADSWEHVASFALLPVLLGWIIAYLLLWMARWVLAGRKISN